MAANFVASEILSCIWYFVDRVIRYNSPDYSLPRPDQLITTTPASVLSVLVQATVRQHQTGRHPHGTIKASYQEDLNKLQYNS